MKGPATTTCRRTRSAPSAMVYNEVDGGVAQTYSERARHLIGYCCSQNLGWVKGRDKNDLFKPGHSGQI